MIELGGPRDSSDMTENSEVFHGSAENCEPCEPNEVPDDRLVSLLVLVLVVAVDCRFLTESGMPSHFELTLGTSAGSFLLANVPLVLIDEFEGDVVPLPLLCLRCCSANCSRATCDGSFSDKKPNTELLFFFFFDDVLESLELRLLDGVEARLDDVVLAEVSKDGRWGDEETSELVVERYRCSGGCAVS